VQQLFNKTKNAFGSVDVLVIDARVFKFEPLEAVTADEFHREFNTNVLGSILMIQEEASCGSS
jgi:3-oxoacyl-[acyl-carrier protein] reductase